MEDKLTINDLENRLTEYLKDEEENILNDEYPEDRLHDIVDGLIPIHTGTILEVAESDYWLAVSTPEIYAFTGEHNAINAIVGNIYERLMEEAHGWLAELKKD